MVPLPHARCWRANVRSGWSGVTYCDRMRFKTSTSVSVSVSAHDGIVVLGKAHTRSAPSYSSLPKVSLETVPIFAWMNTDRSRPRRVECRVFLFPTPLLPQRGSTYDALCVLLGSSEPNNSLVATSRYEFKATLFTQQQYCTIHCGFLPIRADNQSSHHPSSSAFLAMLGLQSGEQGEVRSLPQCFNRSPKLPVGMHRTGPCLAS